MATKGLADFEKASRSLAKAVYRLRLYTSGITPRSTHAIANIKKICEEKIPGRYELEVVDVYQQPHLARVDQILAAPTLIKLGPLPVARLVGDMSNRARVLAGLNLEA